MPPLIAFASIALALPWSTAMASPMNDLPFDIGRAQMPKIQNDDDRQRYTQQFECLAGRGEADVYEKLDQQARQRQIDALRQSAAPSSIPKPLLPDNASQGSLPLIPLPPPDRPAQFEFPTGR